MSEYTKNIKLSIPNNTATYWYLYVENKNKALKENYVTRKLARISHWQFIKFWKSFFASY